MRPPILELDQVLHRKSMEAVIQAGNAEEKSRRGRKEETREIDELERPLFTNEGKGKLQRQVIFAQRARILATITLRRPRRPMWAE